MPRPLTKPELLKRAAEARAAAKEAQLQALSYEQIALWLEEAAEKGLTIFDDSVKVRHKMQAHTAPRPPRKVGRPVLVKHRFRSWLDGQGLNVQEWAESHKRPSSTVRAWMRPLNDGGRKIPEGDALLIQNEAGRDDAGQWILPATAVTWPNGFAA